MADIIWSRAGRGVSDALLDGLLACAARSEEGLVWLVPEPYSHACERILAERGGPGLCLRAEVLTFGRLCDRVLASDGGLSRPVLDAGGRLLTLRLALDDVRAQLTLLERAARRTDFLEGLMAAVDECKCYGIGPEALEAASALTEGPPAARLGELSLILSAFEARCAAGVADPRDRYLVLAERLRTGGYAASLRVFAGHFTSFTPQERLVLQILAGKCRGFTLAVAGLPGDDRFEQTNRTVRLLTRPFDNVYHTVSEKPSENPALAYVEENWFDTHSSPPAREGDASGSVELWRAGSAARECRHAAERIRRLVTEDGLRFRDIAVLTADFDVYGPLLQTIFAQYHIPLFADNMDDMAKKPLARLVRSAVDCVSRGYRPDDVVTLLRTGLVGVSDGDADRMEDYLLLWNLRGNRFSGKQPWKLPPGGFGKECGEEDFRTLETLEGIRRRLLTGLRLLEGGQTACGCAQKLSDCLEALGVPESLEIFSRELEEAGEGKLALEAAQMWDIFCDCLEQCAAVLGERPLTPPDFAELFLLVLQSRPVGSIPPSLDRVAAGDMGRFARLPVPVVLLLGADDDKLPARSSPQSLLAREERDALTLAGAELPPDERQRLERELFNIYTAVTLPTRKLIVSYALSETGEDNPSGAVLRLRELLSVEIKDAPPSCYPSREPVRKPSRENLPPGLCRSLYGRTLLLSASRVDTFQNCAFAYFCKYGLKLRKKREPGLKPPDVGLFVHTVLEKTARRVMSEGDFHTVPVEMIRDWAAQYADEYIAGLLRDDGAPPARLKAHLAALRRAARTLAENMARELADSDFAPLDFEIVLDGGEEPIFGVPPSGPEGPDAMRLRGVVDRADGYLRDGTLYLRVVDYKTGSKGFSLRDVYYGVGIQMLLYLFRLQGEAAGRFGAARALPAGVLYVPSQEIVLKTAGPVDSEEAGNLLARQLRRSGLLLDELPVLQAMERGLSTEGRFLPIKLGKDGTPGAKNPVASAARFGRLSVHIDGILRNMARDISSGVVSARPLCKNRAERACDFCDYRIACHFDPETDREVFMRRMNAEQVFALLEGGE